MRLALGITYRGTDYHGWQSQPDGRTVQDHLESALSRFAAAPIRVVCAGRTDTGVHGLNQVVHLDTDRQRDLFSWVRGPNAHLPKDISVQWCRSVPDHFHARNLARGRRYAYILQESVVRPAMDFGRVGWTFRPLDEDRLKAAAAVLIGTHDFSAFRSADCQALSPVKELRRIDVTRHGSFWRFDFEASAFLHHMVRNLMGCLVMVGTGVRDVAWLEKVLVSRSRALAAPTFSADGLFFLTALYDAEFDLPRRTSAFDALPGGLTVIDP